MLAGIPHRDRRRVLKLPPACLPLRRPKIFAVLFKPFRPLGIPLFLISGRIGSPMLLSFIVPAIERGNIDVWGVWFCEVVRLALREQSATGFCTARGVAVRFQADRRWSPRRTKP